MLITVSFLRAVRRATQFVSLLVLASGVSAVAATKTVAPPADAPPKDEFSRLVKLAPFVVRGQQLSVSIHARTGRDRSYAQDFAEEVLKVMHESGVTDSTGKGLVIIGQKGEPHPIRFFRQFLALAEAGKLDPAVAARGAELHADIEHWQRRAEVGHSDKFKISVDKDHDADGNVDMEFEKIVTALPLPLSGIGAQLYQLAWFEKFDDAKVEAKLRTLRAGDLEGNLFARYDWVFYLPPRGAFDAVLDEIINEALKQDDVGFVGRMAVKSVMVFVRPKIRKVIEGVRHGLMFDCVARARAKLDDESVSALTGAYIEQFIPGEHKEDGPEHERVVRAIRAELKSLREKPAPKPDDSADTKENAPQH